MTTTPDHAARATYAERLRRLSEMVIGAVHDEGPAQVAATITAALRLPPPGGVDPVTALVTVLAAQVDPEASLTDRLGWVEPTPPVAAVPGRPGPSPTAPCGTESAYARHVRNGEPTDRACRAARARGEQARAAGRRAQAGAA